MRSIKRVTVGESILINSLRDPGTRHLLMTMLERRLEEMDATKQAMLADRSLDELDTFNEVFGQHMVDKGRMEMLKEDLINVDNGF